MHSKLSDRKSNLLNISIESKETIIMDNFLENGRSITKANRLVYISAIILLCMFQLILPRNAISAANESCKQDGNCSSNEKGIKPVDRNSVRRANRYKALKDLAISGYQLVLWGSETPSPNNDVPYSKEQYTEKLNEQILHKISNWVAITKETLVKDEFETTQAFELRQKEYDKEYNAKVKARESQLEQERPAIYAEGFSVLGTPVLNKVEYDADQEIFNLSISAIWADYVINAKVKVPVASAKETKSKIESMIPWVVFQIDGEKVIPKSVILQNKVGTASSIKRLDFTDRQENQALSIGHRAYEAIISAKKQLRKRLHGKSKEKAAQMASAKVSSVEPENQPQQSRETSSNSESQSTNGEILYAYLKRHDPDKPGSFEEEYVDGQVISKCTVGGKYPAYFGWVRSKTTFLMGYPVPNPKVAKNYIFVIDMNQEFKIIFRSEEYVNDVYSAMRDQNCEIPNG